ncbi:hypothetical protein LTS18_012221, partial [Coniosporium uncinatum]
SILSGHGDVEGDRRSVREGDRDLLEGAETADVEVGRKESMSLIDADVPVHAEPSRRSTGMSERSGDKIVEFER